jgi:peptide-methionine (R)-S-oxide reductase
VIDKVESSDRNVDRVIRSDAEWRALLTPLAYNVTRKNGTERPFSGEYVGTTDHGVYQCVCCDAELFLSSDKVPSDSGWPSFRAPVSAGVIRTGEDCSWLVRRTDARCARCDAHLGHVFPVGFPEGQEPGTLTWCVNSVGLRFIRNEG